MNCRDLERLLERYVAGELPLSDREAAHGHVDACAGCRDLVQLARIAYEPANPAEAEPPPGLVADVLSRTAGSSCTAAERALCDYVDRELPGERRRGVAAHLGACPECSSLAGALARLSTDLPRLAEIDPGERFVHSVLAATLPAHVRLRRWWQQTWPRWVQRPRFAVEAAYVSTLILVLIFSVPGSPLQAMPGQAAELARTAPVRTISDPWGRLEEALGGKLDEFVSSEGTEAVIESWRGTLDLGTRVARRSVELGEQAYSWTSSELRTFWERLASVLERAGETSSPADPDPDEEKS